jgi:hypothetical protein
MDPKVDFQIAEIDNKMPSVDSLDPTSIFYSQALKYITFPLLTTTLDMAPYFNAFQANAGDKNTVQNFLI